MKPTRKAAKTSFDAHARAQSTNTQKGVKPMRKGTQSTGAKKSLYVRKSVGLSPTGVPMKRTAEGSKISSGYQPKHNAKGQKMSRLKKGAD